MFELSIRAECPVAIKSAPIFFACFQNAPNLISLLQSTSGLGVRPTLYSAIILSTTPFLYSFSKSKKRKGISSAIATLMASRRSSLQLQGKKSGCQTLINTPVTSYPRSEEHTSELQSQSNLACRLLLEKKNA